MSNVINKNIFFDLKKKLSSFKVTKLNKLFPKFLPVLYLNQINIFSNRINNFESIIILSFKKAKNVIS